jgi:hypothetical protein
MSSPPQLRFFQERRAKHLIIIGIFLVLFEVSWLVRRFVRPRTPASRPSASLRTPSVPISETITDGPFSYDHFIVPNGFAPIHLRLPSSELRGVVYLFHGCSHVGQDFFRLLEERAIVANLTARGFAAVAFTAADKVSRCWMEEDMAPVRSSIKKLDFNRQLPTFAFGASSGGSFVTTLSAGLIDGVIVEVSPGDPSTAEELVVPVAFIYMPKDMEWASQSAIEGVREKLAQREVKSVAFEVKPFRMNRWIFHQKLPEFFNVEESKDVFEKLIGHMLIERDGRLRDDPRQTGIAEQTMQIIGRRAWKWKQLLEDNLVELYNVAWASHELTREKVPDALDFLLEHRFK